MKTAHHKTAQFPKMKRLAMYFSFIVVLCFFKLVYIKAQDPHNLTRTTNTQPTTTLVVQEEPESPIIEYFDQKASQLFNILSTVMKNMKEMASSVTRNML